MRDQPGPGRALARLLAPGLLAILPLTSLAAERCHPPVAQLLSVQGPIEIQPVGQGPWRAVRADEGLCPGDSLRAGRFGRAAVLLLPETQLRLDAGTTLNIPAEPANSNATWLDLLTGAVHFISRHPRPLRIKTPFVNAAIDGTEFILRVDDSQTGLWVVEGRVTASNPAGSLVVEGGQAAVAQAGQAPVRRLDLRPTDAVAWALHYPRLLDGRPPAAPAADARAQVLAMQRQAGIQAALDQAMAIPEEAVDADFLALRAGLLLGAGRVAEAGADLDKALGLNPDQGSALALKAIAALVRDERDAARQAATRAVERAPGSPQAHLALSYVQQADFQLPAALSSVERALALDGEDALAWARLAELRLALGEARQARDAAARAVGLDSGLAHPHTILGFAALGRADMAAARQAFQEAIRLDSSDPLPRLGLGLTRIRAGELAAGRGEIEAAASLDPSDALIRAYLGKAYFDEKRDGLANTQYQLAREFDPRDPTPWYYQALLEQSRHRPGEALAHLEQSIARNDGRAVYRSRLLLDQDQAARQASAARIYTDLGFARQGLLRGWQSVHLDPANHSAHRFLADGLAHLPRAEIARASEQLQAQLLQPLSPAPVPPQSAEAKLLLPRDSGPAYPSLNEYNALYLADGGSLRLGLAAGSDDTFAHEVVVSGLWNRVALSLGQFHYQTDGYRLNNDMDQDLGNLFIQAALTPEFSAQAEFRRRRLEHGDLNLNLRQDGSLPLRTDKRVDTDRLGFNFHPAPQTTWLASVTRVEPRETLEYEGPFTITADAEGYVAETQFQWRGRGVALVGGLGRYDLDYRTTLDPPFFVPDDYDVAHDNAYLYSLFDITPELAATLGLGRDDLDNGAAPDFRVRRWNPKLGLMWSANPGLTLRMAGFATVMRDLYAVPTLEPTQVAGFNQFFDDLLGTRTRFLGVALDQQPSPDLHLGLEISQRDLDVPITATPLILEDWRERLYQAHADWLPHPRWAVHASVQKEHFQREPLSLLPTPTRMDTWRLPVEVRHFLPGGLGVQLRTTYVHQRVDLPAVNGLPASGGLGDDFLLVDLGLRYRLPGRRGSLSLEVKNLFDRNFVFEGHGYRATGNIATPEFLPERTWVLGLSLAL